MVKPYERLSPLAQNDHTDLSNINPWPDSVEYVIHVLRLQELNTPCYFSSSVLSNLYARFNHEWEVTGINYNLCVLADHLTKGQLIHPPASLKVESKSSPSRHKCNLLVEKLCPWPLRGMPSLIPQVLLVFGEFYTGPHSAAMACSPFSLPWIESSPSREQSQFTGTALWDLACVYIPILPLLHQGICLFNWWSLPSLKVTLVFSRVSRELELWQIIPVFTPLLSATISQVQTLTVPAPFILRLPELLTSMESHQRTDNWQM